MGEGLHDSEGQYEQSEYRSKAQPAAAWTTADCLVMLRAPKYFIALNVYNFIKSLHNMKPLIFLTFFTTYLIGCQKSNDANISTTPRSNQPENYYYPPLTGDVWETKTAVSIGWDEGLLKQAFDFAGTKNTFGLIVLQHGKIVKEQYWNNWTKDTRYYIASAGKSVVGFVAGIAQQEGILNINHKTSQYLGTGWTALPLAKENLITIKN